MTERKTKIRMTHLLLGFAVIAAIGSYAYGMWLASQQEQRLIPRLALNSATKVLLGYHKKAGQFPDTLAEVDLRSWPLRPAPVIGHHGHSLYSGNYFYLYYATAPGVCHIWALPTGSRREDGLTYFLVLSPDGIRRWKGPALSDQEIKEITLTPTEAQLASIGLIEQSAIYFKQPPKSNRRSS